METVKRDFTGYNDKISDRSKRRYLIGLLPRFINHYKSQIICSIARAKGAKIGSNTYIPLKLALVANENLIVGNSSIIETTDIDLREKVTVGDNVIINKGVVIIRASHKTSTKEFETVYSQLLIEDYSWITTKSLILPGCKVISRGSILGAGSVLGTSIKEPSSIYIGNPASFLKQRKNFHENLVTESLQGRDFEKYLQVFLSRKNENR